MRSSDAVDVEVGPLGHGSSCASLQDRGDDTDEQRGGQTDADHGEPVLHDLPRSVRDEVLRTVDAGEPADVGVGELVPPVVVAAVDVRVALGEEGGQARASALRARQVAVGSAWNAATSIAPSKERHTPAT